MEPVQRRGFLAGCIAALVAPLAWLRSSTADPAVRDVSWDGPGDPVADVMRVNEAAKKLVGRSLVPAVKFGVVLGPEPTNEPGGLGWYQVKLEGQEGYLVALGWCSNVINNGALVMVLVPPGDRPFIVAQRSELEVCHIVEEVDVIDGGLALKVTSRTHLTQAGAGPSYVEYRDS